MVPLGAMHLVYPTLQLELLLVGVIFGCPFRVANKLDKFVVSIMQCKISELVISSLIFSV